MSQICAITALADNRGGEDAERKQSRVRDQLILMKFGKREHLEAIRQRGELYLNPIEYFASLDGDKVRRDPYEGTDSILQPHDVKELRIQAGERLIRLGSKSFTSPLRLAFGSRPRMNIYCMYSISLPPSVPLVDDSNHAFGDSFLMILNTELFLRKLRAAARSAGLRCLYKPVRYFDKHSYSGDTGPFRKPLDFSHQREFRIVVAPGSEHPVRLYLGSLKRLTSKVLPLEKVNDIVRIPWDTSVVD